MTKTNPIIEEAVKRFEESGFGNQAIIKGTKRVEIKDFLSSELQTAISKTRENTVEEICHDLFVEEHSCTWNEEKHTMAECPDAGYSIKQYFEDLRSNLLPTKEKDD